MTFRTHREKPASSANLPVLSETPLFRLQYYHTPEILFCQVISKILSI
ncbi:MAG: hypothetical protein K2K06_02435 [Oscillospiraceae bacterium]|nr:hypothetical protein [Ruminococcus sp.]MDE6706878.1 hypothetical protein [Oscillospiraceae bacterium]